jgi:hypothetical protein
MPSAAAVKREMDPVACHAHSLIPTSTTAAASATKLAVRRNLLLARFGIVISDKFRNGLSHKDGPREDFEYTRDVLADKSSVDHHARVQILAESVLP